MFLRRVGRLWTFGLGQESNFNQEVNRMRTQGVWWDFHLHTLGADLTFVQAARNDLEGRSLGKQLCPIGIANDETHPVTAEIRGDTGEGRQESHAGFSQGLNLERKLNSVLCFLDVLSFLCSSL